MNNYLESTGLLTEEQAAFRKHYSTTNHIFSLKMLVDFCLYKKKRLYCAFIDYRKAFDSVNRVLFGEKYYVITLMVKFSKSFSGVVGWCDGPG